MIRSSASLSSDSPIALLERRISPPSASTIDIVVSRDDACSCFLAKPGGKIFGIINVLFTCTIKFRTLIIHPLGLPYVSNLPS